MKYATSFEKSQEYIDSLHEEVERDLFRDTVDNNFTPQYVFEEIKGIHHSPEHPLINKGLLGSTKVCKLVTIAAEIALTIPTATIELEALH